MTLNEPVVYEVLSAYNEEHHADEDPVSVQAEIVTTTPNFAIQALCDDDCRINVREAPVECDREGDREMLFGQEGWIDCLNRARIATADIHGGIEGWERDYEVTDVEVVGSDPTQGYDTVVEVTPDVRQWNRF